ncbi:MAG TPA: hypothetical protein VMU19_11410 [Bryobacteraceae bacterium]|nr:hypothetical protein [Bryobacteraceae bacterium]
MALAAYVRATGRGAYALAFASAAAFVVSIVALISVVSVYFYELPTHHCPFCILQKEYGRVGYPLYLSLLMGAVTGIGAGAIGPFRAAPSLRTVVPRIQRNLALASLVSYLVFLGIILRGVAASNLRM